jgi:hypothetical protein
VLLAGYPLLLADGTARPTALTQVSPSQCDHRLGRRSRPTQSGGKADDRGARCR